MSLAIRNLHEKLKKISTTATDGCILLNEIVLMSEILLFIMLLPLMWHLLQSWLSYSMYNNRMPISEPMYLVTMKFVLWKCNVITSLFSPVSAKILPKVERLVLTVTIVFQIMMPRAEFRHMYFRCWNLTRGYDLNAHFLITNTIWDPGFL